LLLDADAARKNHQHTGTKLRSSDRWSRHVQECGARIDLHQRLSIVDIAPVIGSGAICGEPQYAVCLTL
jgi:hypothetical protein